MTAMNETRQAIEDFRRDHIRPEASTADQVYNLKLDDLCDLALKGLAVAEVAPNAKHVAWVGTRLNAAGRIDHQGIDFCEDSLEARGYDKSEIAKLYTLSETQREADPDLIRLLGEVQGVLRPSQYDGDRRINDRIVAYKKRFKEIPK